MDLNRDFRREDHHGFLRAGVGKLFPVQGQMANTLDFASHTVPVPTIQFNHCIKKQTVHKQM